MADFYQTGVVTTLHRLGETRLDRRLGGVPGVPASDPPPPPCPRPLGLGAARGEPPRLGAAPPVLRDAAAADRHLVARRTAGAGAVPPSRRGADLHRHPGHRPHRLAPAGPG